MKYWMHSIHLEQIKAQDQMLYYILYNLKRIISDILTPLTSLINLSLQNGMVPTDWKMINATSIKMGDRTISGKYWHISLTSVVWAILENKIRSKIVTYLESHLLSKDSQHDFRNKISICQIFWPSIVAFSLFTMVPNQWTLFIWTFKKRLIKLLAKNFFYKTKN